MGIVKAAVDGLRKGLFVPTLRDAVKLWLGPQALLTFGGPHEDRTPSAAVSAACEPSYVRSAQKAPIRGISPTPGLSTTTR